MISKSRRARAGLAGLAAIAALSACGEDQGGDNQMTLEPTLEAVSIRALDGFSELGGDVSALTLLPPVAIPTSGRAVASVEGVGLVLLDLFESRARETSAPQAASLISAPLFRYRGAAAPLVVGVGGELEEPTVFLYIAGAEALERVLADPIAPDFDVVSLCAVRHTQALLEFLAIGESRAQRWRLRDLGQERLSAELVGEADDFAGARACSIAPDGSLITLNGDGRINGEGPVREATTIAAVRIEPYEFALLSRPEAGDIGAVNRATGRLVARFRIDEALNAPAAEHPAIIAVSDENFGGAAYRGGLIAVADGDAVSLVSLEQLLGGLRPADGDPSSDDDG